MIIATAPPPPVAFSPLRLQAARLDIVPSTAAVAKGLTENMRYRVLGLDHATGTFGPGSAPDNFQNPSSRP